MSSVVYQEAIVYNEPVIVKAQWNSVALILIGKVLTF